jgi:hypothetical protein
MVVADEFHLWVESGSGSHQAGHPGFRTPTRCRTGGTIDAVPGGLMGFPDMVTAWIWSDSSWCSINVCPTI